VDLGAPASYLTLGEGVPVYSSDEQELGRVEHVLADQALDIFEGLVLDRSRLHGGHRFVDAEQIAEIYERGVLLLLTAAEAAELPVPTSNPAAISADAPADDEGGELSRKLHRAWERISGKS
jgi:uncharacterized protein YrrD